MRLIERLRHATGEQHEALHVHPLLSPLQSDRVTLADYRWCICAFHLAYMGIQTPYAPPAADVPALLWLEKDMKVHEIDDAVVDMPDYPVIDSFSKYLGYGYVKHGSTLGGRVISRHLSRTLGLRDGVTNHFFAGFGEQTGVRWKNFLTLLDDEAIDANEAVAQAVQIFSLIADCCDSVLTAKKDSALT